ncbi:MAG: isoamylase early set domain-containing protein [Sphaerochaetaceae bacterium]|jgi:hypothetical protein|nr:isoamylase early set domain-containing protein [Sphaerochaetaceae bacterium]MDD2406789.1 isoamylase early set domain-containing protein [Sphaerochaetaceae bacterium]MDD3671297.1 isoamylase early set domain-containing protein [Sphaerochaetaceae bacterium]MDD4260333.1 isoamylase early set domain-containing protein [Sphaerochaetaceae bacterium]NLO59605.1 hypothetical protein [Spirochaetales bacterium]
MNCSECKAYIDTWYAQHNTSEEGKMTREVFEREVADHIASCPSCALHYELARKLAGEPGATDTVSFDYPQGMEQRLSHSILDSITHTHAAKPSRFNTQRHIIRRYVLVAAAVCAVALVPFAVNTRPHIVSQSENEVTVAEVILQIEAPEAETVVVVGDWNNWDPQAQHLAKINEQGMWHIKLQLERGKEYRYQFLINGTQWKADPNAYMQVDDGFGGQNSILEI